MSLFGGSPGRPDHADFWRMSEVILQMDATADEKGLDGIELMIRTTCDLPSLVYMAEQRTARFAYIAQHGKAPAFGTPVEQASPMLLMLYVEAFIAGTRFAGGPR